MCIKNRTQQKFEILYDEPFNYSAKLKKEEVKVRLNRET
jgi:hypothetical protein